MWRRAAWVVAALVVSTAAMARQEITDDTGSETALLSDSYPGIMRPRDVTTVALPTAVTVKRIAVAVGDHVRAGQPIMEFDDAEARRVVSQLTLEAERAKAQTNELAQGLALIDRSIHGLTVGLAQANAQLAMAQRHMDTIPNRQWKDSPERAQAAYDQAIAHERRLTDLAANGVIARQELEDAHIAVRMAADDLAVAKRAADAAGQLSNLQALQARAQADLAVADQRRQRAERSAELAQARLRQQQAEETLAAATARLNDLAIRASGEALVAEVSVRAGDRALAGAPLLKLATLDPMVVDVDVPPAIVNTLRRGETAIIHIAGATQERQAKILTIAPLPGDAGAHTIEVAFDNPSQTLLTGQMARVRFSVHR